MHKKLILIKNFKISNEFQPASALQLRDTIWVTVLEDLHINRYIHVVYNLNTGH